MDDSNEEYEILDLANYKKKDWIEKLLGDISKQSAAKQAVIGGVAGWGAGFLFIKVGKLAAASLGTTILLLQIAQHKGYVKINWTRVEKSISQAKSEMRREASKHYPGIFENMQRFIQQNICLATGFAGGFFFGVAF